ncbi:MAG: response regulator [Pseudomonadota bacterium]
MIKSPSHPPLRRVFVVEDDHAVREALVMLVEAEGWPCSAFSNGERFLEIARPSENDVLILDLDLPGIGGTEIAASLKARGISPSIYVISGLRNRAFEAGVERIQPVAAFRKPLDTAGLLTAVASHNPPSA